MRQILTELGITIGYLFAGLCGAFVFRPKGEFKWHEFLIRLISGAICANYITPFILGIIPIFANFSFGVAFIMGYGGVHIADAVTLMIKNKISKI